MFPLSLLPVFTKIDLLKYGLILSVVFGLIYKAYDWSWDRGYAARDKTAQGDIYQLQQSLFAAQKELKDMKDAQRAYKEAAEAKESQLLASLAAKDAQQEALRKAKETELKNVRAYITDAADRKCQLSLGTVRLFNRAALPTLQVDPSRDTGDVDAPGDVALSELGEVVKDNYLTCNRWRDQLIQWQSWYKEWAEWTAPVPVN